MADGTQKVIFDAEQVRADFPILSTTVYGKPFVFLDTAASAQKPATVIAAEKDLYEGYYANIHRGVYKYSQEATSAYEAGRDALKSFINAKHSHECILVRGATEGINLVAQSWGRANVQAGDEIIVSELEHHSNIVPWQMLATEKGATIRVIPLLEDGQLDLEVYKNLLNDRTKLVAVGHVSNAIGTVNPVKDMIRMAHAVGAVVMVDGCQATPHMKVDVQDLDADFYAMSAHKMYGPSGIGAVYAKEALLNAMPPWQGGGDMIDRVSLTDGTTWNSLPYKFEAGTPNIAGGIGWKAAIDYMNQFSFDALHAHEMELLEYANAQLTQFNSLRLIGTAPNKSALISFVLDGIHPHDVGTILDQKGIAVRVGHHCAQPLMDRFGVPGTVRASFGIYNTKQDVDALVDGLRSVIKLFG